MAEVLQCIYLGQNKTLRSEEGGSQGLKHPTLGLHDLFLTGGLLVFLQTCSGQVFPSLV